MAKRATAKKEATVETAVEVVENGKTKKIEAIVLNKAQQKQYDESKTISAKIRYLHSEGFGRSQISLFTGKRYQHVRNVLESPLKRQA